MNPGHKLTADQQENRHSDGKFGSFRHDEPKTVVVEDDDYGKHSDAPWHSCDHGHRWQSVQDDTAIAAYTHLLADRCTGIVPMNLSSTHADPDPAMVAALATDMAARGWQGAPVLAWGELAITGTHRIAAAKSIGLAVPVLDIIDLVDDADAKLGAIMDGCGLESLEAAALLFRLTLGEAVADDLGLDLDTHGYTAEDAAWALKGVDEL